MYWLGNGNVLVKERICTGKGTDMYWLGNGYVLAMF